MLPFRPESSTLPSGFRFHHDERPSTPEPIEVEQVPPPRQPRRLKRRNVLRYSFDPPTGESIPLEIPLPSIEIPEYDEHVSEHLQYQTAAGFLAPAYRNSPPKTPIPQTYADTDEYDTNRPDWSMVVTPERPMSAMSNPSEYSDDSYFSSIRTSRASEDELSSPDEDFKRSFVFPSIKGKEALPAVSLEVKGKGLKNAHWTKDMSAHLWQTYQIYLADSTVTPFRVGASGVPPEGVIVRVAREAKRSWRGPKQDKMSGVQTTIPESALESDPSAMPARSGSITPTGDASSKPYQTWPHSSAATRNHLRELCKKDSVSVHRHRHMQSKSPTPFTHFRARSEGHAVRPSATFSTKDIALSLVTSTANSMRPDGPLAQLTASKPPKPVTPRPFSFDGYCDDPFVDKPEDGSRLGSPFVSSKINRFHSYGPSSSHTLASFGRPSPKKADGPKLGSPVRFGARSLQGTGKRRAPDFPDDEITPITRPSILDDQLFGGPLESNKRRTRSRGFSLGNESIVALPPSISMPQMPTHAPHDSSSPFNNAPSLLPSATFASPADREDRILTFNDSGNSATFPRRLLQPAFESSGSERMRRRQYTTVHHPRRSIESFDFGTGPSLESRVAELDRKLAALRAREEARGRGGP